MVCLTSNKIDTKLVSEALKVLGKDNLALIIHGSSFPSKQGEDTGFGTFNSEAGHELIDYAHGIFNALQLGPAGKTKSDDEKSSFQISFYLTQAELKELKDYIETLPISSTPSRVAKECYFRGLKSLNNRN